MRILRGIAAFVLGLALLAVGAPSASASVTYHGTFAGGTGYNVGGIAPYFIAEGDHQLNLAGEWNVNVGSQGVQVVGNLRTATQYPNCELMPCPWGMNLQAGDPWVKTAPGVYSSTVGNGTVTFFRTLNINRGAEFVLSMRIEGCPYGWTSWNIPGTPRQG